MGRQKASQHVKIEASQCSNYSQQEGLFDKAQGRGHRSCPVCLPCLPTWTQDHSPPKALQVLSHFTPWKTTTTTIGIMCSLEMWLSDLQGFFFLCLPFSCSLSRPHWTWLIGNYDKALVAVSKLSPGSQQSSLWLIISLCSGCIFKGDRWWREMWREAWCLRPQSWRRLCLSLSADILTDEIWKHKQESVEVTALSKWKDCLQKILCILLIRALVDINIVGQIVSTFLY